MTTEIPIEQWKEFFDNISRELVNWETNVEVMSDDTGAQMLAEGLPFGGLTFEDSPPTVELVLGDSPDGHQSHTIAEPVMVAFDNTGLGPSGVLDIEDRAGNKTLIKFVQPYPMLVEYVKAEMISV